jgi:hypothetical protein
MKRVKWIFQSVIKIAMWPVMARREFSMGGMIVIMLVGVIIPWGYGYIFTTGSFGNLIQCIIWYFIYGIVLNILHINIEGCGFLNLPYFSEQE